MTNNRSYSPIWLAAVVVAATAGIFAALYPMLATDTACRYAPMAEAFSRGEWSEAFHPRFGIGMSILAGGVSTLSGLDGYASCSFVATVGWALGIVPLFFIAERVFDRRTAWVSVVLYVICPQLLIWGLKGLREPFKVLGALLMVDAVFRRWASNCWLSAVEAGLGFTTFVFFKSDAILLAIIMALVYGAYDRFMVRTWILAAWGALALQPLCFLVWSWTGYWLPAPHFVPIWKRLFGG